MQLREPNYSSDRVEELSLFDPRRRRLLALIVGVVVVGGLVLVQAATQFPRVPLDITLGVLAIITIASGRFAIKVPGRSATVSMSEVFLFASVLLYGPAPATLLVALDGFWVSCGQKHRCLYRALFNIAEPAISIWFAGQAFFLIAGPLQAQPAGLLVVVAAVGMAAVFFASNSFLTAAAIGWEGGGSAYEMWSRHALYLGVNYYAAASLAALATGFSQSPALNLPVVGLAVPLLVLSYVAYKEASTRVDDAHKHVREVTHLYEATVEMLAMAVESKDQGTHGHVRRVQRYAHAVARALGVVDASELQAIEAGSVLHDIGKLAVPDHILNKPGVLSRVEYDTMKRHTVMGARILTAVDFPYPVVPIVRHHHERWDGQGYPDGLTRTEIPLGARILSVVDCFDALTSDRPYRPALSDERAVEILKSRSGVFYDPAVVDRFIELVPQFRRYEGAPAEPSELIGSVVARMARQGGEAAANAPDEEFEASPVPAMDLEAADLIEKRTKRIQGAEACLFLLTRSGDELVLAYATTSRLRDATSALQLPIGQGLSGWVAANRSTIRNADPSLDLKESAARLGFRWCTGTPVFAHGDLVGALTVYLARQHRFTDAEGHVVGTIGQEVGLTLAHAEAAHTVDARLALASARGIAAVS